MNSPFKIDEKKPIAKGVAVGDEYYHTADIVQVVEENEIKFKVVDNKEKIRDVIDANADKCGLKNILRIYARTGDVSLFNARPYLNGIDATNLPEKTVEEIKKELPADLLGDKSVEEFLASISAQDLVEYFKAKEKVEEGGSSNE